MFNQKNKCHVPFNIKVLLKPNYCGLSQTMNVNEIKKVTQARTNLDFLPMRQSHSGYLEEKTQQRTTI